MLKHARAGVPMEVMGLMLGEFVDEYTISVVDVFAMPQSGTGVSVEAVDDVFQTQMMELVPLLVLLTFSFLKSTGRPEMVVGWYHSHPGFGCWLSSVDIQTQQAFENLTPRAVAVVVDPIQSVKGKVVIDAFRLIQATTMMMGMEPRQTTSNQGHINKPSIQALIHGLGRHYYSLSIATKRTSLEQAMLLSLHKKEWTSALTLQNFSVMDETNRKDVESMKDLAKGYCVKVKEESSGALSKEELERRHVGKRDEKRHLGEAVERVMEDNITALLAGMLDRVSF
jgi:26S proteasome regulatory subunit N11